VKVLPSREDQVGGAWVQMPVCLGSTDFASMVTIFLRDLHS